MTSFGANRFSSDDGSADPALAEVLARWSDADPSAPAGRALREEVVATLAGTRVLLPIIAVGSEPGTDDEDRASGAPRPAVDMRMAMVEARDGRRTLPVFTSLAAMMRWTEQARPVPTEMQRAALSAVEEECQLIVVDPAGPVTFVLPRPAVWALAQGESWRSPLDDVEVLAEVQTWMVAHPALRRLAAAPGREAEVAIEVTLPAAVAADDVEEALAALQRAIARSTTVANRVDSLELRVLRG